MESLKEIKDAFVKKENSYNKRQNKIEQQITELKDKLDRMQYPSHGKLFKPMAEEIKNRLNSGSTVSIETYGPFGMCSEISWYWIKDKIKGIAIKGNVLGSITFINSGENWAIRNSSKEVNSYPKGSIGAMNGMNYKTIEITDKMGIDWLLKYVKRNR